MGDFHRERCKSEIEINCILAQTPSEPYVRDRGIRPNEC